MLPTGTGTRQAYASSLSLSSGMTLTTAFAAPVLVGTMFSAAFRPLRKSFLSGNVFPIL